MHVVLSLRASWRGKGKREMVQTLHKSPLQMQYTQERFERTVSWECLKLIYSTPSPSPIQPSESGTDIHLCGWSYNLILHLNSREMKRFLFASTLRANPLPEMSRRCPIQSQPFQIIDFSFKCLSIITISNVGGYRRNIKPHSPTLSTS